MKRLKDNNIRVIHIPEICQYNEFIDRTINIQKKKNINVLDTGICIDAERSGTNNLLDALKYKQNNEDKLVIHFHWPEKLYKNVSFEEFKRQIDILKENDIKLVKTIHNLKPHEMAEENKLKDDYLYNKLDGIILFSKSQLESFTEINNSKKAEEVIPHPNYNIKKTDEKSILKEKEFVLCVPGRIRQYKQTDIILEILNKIKNDKVKILVVGKPDDKQSIEKLKKCSSNNLKCIFEFVPSNELEKYLKNSDMVLLTHKKIWTSGIAILSGNLGVPLVGTLPKIFEDYNYNELGYFLEKDEEMNSKKLTKLINLAISDGKDIMNSKAQKLKKILAENSDEKIGKLYFRFYNNLFDKE